MYRRRRKLPMYNPRVRVNDLLNLDHVIVYLSIVSVSSVNSLKLSVLVPPRAFKIPLVRSW